MPLKLKPPRDKSPNWTLRGTYLGVRVSQTTGTPDPKVAERKLAQLKNEIERGAFSRQAPTMKTIQELGDICEAFGRVLLKQRAVNKACLALVERLLPDGRLEPLAAALREALLESVE